MVLLPCMPVIVLTAIPFGSTAILCSVIAGVEDVLYQNLTGSTVSGIQLTLNYGSASPTNSSATPEMRRITIKDVNIHAGSFLTCNGLPDSEIEGIIFDNVVVTGGSHQSCSDCTINAKNTSPQPKCGAPSPPAPPPALCRVTTKVGCYDDSKNVRRRALLFPSFSFVCLFVFSWLLKRGGGGYIQYM